MSYLLIDPDEDLDYQEDWSNWLDPTITITSATWAIVPTGPTLHDQIDTATTSRIFVSGCTVGVVYLLSCTVITDNTTPQTAERSIALRCEQR